MPASAGAAITTSSSRSTPSGPSPSPLAMNKYAHMAMRHWERFLPDRLAAIPEKREGRVLRGAGGAGGGGDRAAAGPAGGAGSGGGGVSGEGGAAERGADAGGGDRVAGADPAGAERSDPEAEDDDSLPEADRQFYEDLRRIRDESRRVAFTPVAGEQLAPSGEKARVEANLAALRLLADLERAGPRSDRLTSSGRWRPGRVGERSRPCSTRTATSGQPSGTSCASWSATPDTLAARRTTINAHYTDPAVVAAIWQLVPDLGFDGGRVLEPGCGIGTFLGLAPQGAELTGVELDPATARLAQALYPHATVRCESFADTRLPDGHFDLDGRERAVRGRAAA